MKTTELKSFCNKKETPAQIFFYEFCEIFESISFAKHHQITASMISIKSSEKFCGIQSCAGVNFNTKVILVQMFSYKFCEILQNICFAKLL